MRKLLTLLALLISFSIIVPGAAQVTTIAWDSGTASNTDSGTTYDSTWDSGTADNTDTDTTSGSDQTYTQEQDSSWDDGTATNDDDGSTSSQDSTWDNETATNDDGAEDWDNETVTNNESAWDNETAVNDDDANYTDNETWDNETAVNDDDAWDNETATNDDDGEQDEVDDEPDNDGGPISGIIDFLRPSGITLELGKDTVGVGEQVEVSGQLQGDNNANRTVKIMVDGIMKKVTKTDNSGNYQKNIVLDEPGDREITVEAADQEATKTITVASSVEIVSIVTSSDISVGEMISVCPKIESDADATVTLYQNDQQVGQKQGTGEICFDVVAESGENVFKVVAEVDGEQDTEQITRTIGGVDSPEEPADEEQGFNINSLPLKAIFSILGGAAVTLGIMYREGMRVSALTG